MILGGDPHVFFAGALVGVPQDEQPERQRDIELSFEQPVAVPLRSSRHQTLWDRTAPGQEPEQEGKVTLDAAPVCGAVSPTFETCTVPPCPWCAAHRLRRSAP